jgi:hypothetical protein
MSAQATTVFGSHAPAYAKAGIAVLPLHWPTEAGCSCEDADCKSPAKHPLTAKGLDAATTDAAVIADWAARVPLANIGVRPVEGVVALDVDPRHGGGVALAELLAAGARQLSPTLTANTGGGGLHIWYRCPGPYRRKLCDGVDLKGHSGYLVAPPSLHSSGRRYRWANRLPIAEAPAWLAQMIQRPVVVPMTFSRMSSAVGPFAPLSRAGNAEDGLVRTVAEAPEGNRNNALHWAACCAFEKGGDEALLDRVRDAARTAGLGDREIEQTLRSARRTAGAAS